MFITHSQVAVNKQRHVSPEFPLHLPHEFHLHGKLVRLPYVVLIGKGQVIRIGYIGEDIKIFNYSNIAQMIVHEGQLVCTGQKQIDCGVIRSIITNKNFRTKRLREN